MSCLAFSQRYDQGCGEENEAIMGEVLRLSHASSSATPYPGQ